jgi:hypothetical protein
MSHFIFDGHAIGAAAQFHRLDDSHNLNHIIPALGASVLPATGGVSKSQVLDYSYDVDQPRKRTLLSVRRVDSIAAGRQIGERCETEIWTEIESIDVVEKLHMDLVKLHMLSTRETGESDPVVSTTGNRLDGVRLGNVEAQITLDEEPLAACGTKEQLAAFYRTQTAQYRCLNSWRFRTDPQANQIAAHGRHLTYSLVREIKLVGPEQDKQDIEVHGYTIHWKGFGKIILGEVVVKDQDRQLTMVRLAMGSDAGGDGSVGDGRTNGMVGT